MRAHIASREALFQVLEERRVDRHHVFKVAVLRAILHHQDLAVALDDLRLDLAHLFVQQNFVRQLAVKNLLANLRYALGAKRIGRARPAQRRLFLLPALLQRLVAPLRRECVIGADPVQLLKNNPRSLGCVYGGFLYIFNGFWHVVRSPQIFRFLLMSDWPADLARALSRIHERKSGAEIAFLG